jgi:fatty-acyl-CoA synthase
VAQTIGGVLAEYAALSPERPALFYMGQVISYAKFFSESVRATQALYSLGVRRGDRVGVLLGNRPEWLIAAFGALHLGAICAPLNTWYKEQELAWAIEHAGISVIITAGRFLKHDYAATFERLVPELHDAPAGALKSARFPSLRGVVFVDHVPTGALGWETFLELASSAPRGALDQSNAKAEPDDPAFILYTSGSTAEPKGVLLHHAKAVANAFEMGERRAVNADDRVWLGTPLFYALGAVNAMPVALTHGASLVLQDHFDAGMAIRTIEATKATVYYGTGNISRAILDHPDYAQHRISSLKKGNAGTYADYKRMTLIEMDINLASAAYGLTESYGNATVSHANDPIEAKLATNGLPLPGTELRIVDPTTFRELPMGEMGLILLRGNVASGYFKNPTETNKAFRKDGFFDTGDLGYLDENGRLVFHSRIKEVIKSGGINVSPLEIEQLLVKHPHIRDAYVVGVEDAVKGERIVAFVDSTQSISEGEVREFVKDTSAAFKVPHHVLFRKEDQLPRLATGKVAKYQLIEEAKRELGLAQKELAHRAR